MRTLPLGVLIVCGGTLAALPFRRYEVIPDASATPTQVTGPTQSALHASQVCEAGSTVDDRLPSLGDLGPLNASRSQYASHGFAAGQSPARQHLEIPLTYDDLAVPIDQPKPVMDRFSATAAVRQQTLEKDRIAGLVMPPMESLPLAQQQELVRVAETMAPQQPTTQSRAAGRLASSSTVDHSGYENSSNQLESLPSSQEVERQRFWIRQPQ